MAKTLPEKFKYLFWDCEFDCLDKNKHRKFIIERMLEKGDFESVKWIMDNFEKDEVRETTKKSLNLSQKTKNFWNIFFSHEFA